MPMASEPITDEFVDLEVAATALGVSSRTAERMIGTGRTTISKRALVALLEELGNAPRRRVAATEQLSQLTEAVSDLTRALAAERRQLVAGADERRALERECQEAVVEAERMRARLELIATAGFFQRRRLLRELRG
jgi:hypothetical protein